MIIYETYNFKELPAISADCTVELAFVLIDIIPMIVIPKFLDTAID